MIEYWNNLVKPSEVDVKAEEGDIVTVIGGIAYLVQTKNGYNNVCCLRVSHSDITTLASFVMFGKYLIGQGIQYIRVEGNTRRYFFLSKLKGFFGEGYNVVKDNSETKRNLFYIKLV